MAFGGQDPLSDFRNALAEKRQQFAKTDTLQGLLAKQQRPAQEDPLGDFRRALQSQSTLQFQPRVDEPLETSQTRAFIGGAVPSAAGLGAALGAGALLGSSVGPIGTAIGAVGAGLLAGLGTEFGKQGLAQRQGRLGDIARNVIASEEEFPLTRLAGSFLPEVPLAAASLIRGGARLATAKLVDEAARGGAKALPGSIFRGQTGRVLTKEVGSAAGGALAAGTISSGLQLGFTGEIDPVQTFGDIVFGAATTNVPFGSKAKKNILEERFDMVVKAQQRDLSNPLLEKSRQALEEELRKMTSWSDPTGRRWLAVDGEAYNAVLDTYTTEVGQELAEDTLRKHGLARGAGAQARDFNDEWAPLIYGHKWARLLPASVKRRWNLVETFTKTQSDEFAIYEQAASTIAATKRIEGRGGRLSSPIERKDAGLNFKGGAPNAQKILKRLDDGPNGELYRERHAIKHNAQQLQLQEMLDGGLINEDDFHNLMNVEAFEPRIFIQHLDSVRGHKTEGGREVTVSESGIKALDEGSVNALLTDSELLFDERTSRLQSRLFKNRAQQSMLRMASESPDPEFLRLATPEEINEILRVPIEDPETGLISMEFRSRKRTAQEIQGNLPGGKMVLSAMENGEAKHMVADERWAQHWVLQDPAIQPELAAAIETWSGTKLLKLMATGLNPEFALANLPRDALFAFMNTNVWTNGGWSRRVPLLGMAQMGWDYFSVIPEVFPKIFTKKSTGLLKRARAVGLGQDFLSRAGRENLKTPELRAIGNVMGFLGEKSETWTRLAVIKRAMANAQDDIANKVVTPEKAFEMAVGESRFMLDFAQGGNWAKALDKGLPYFNAAIQGTRGMFKAAKRDIGGFAWKLTNLGTAGFGLYYANRLYNPEAYDAVPEFEKLNNFIITTGTYNIDDNGEKRWDYIRIPKDQGQRAFLALVEGMAARFLEGKEPSDIALQTMEGLQQWIPIMEGLGIAPPVIQAFAGALANRDFWRNKEIWSGAPVNPEDEFTKITSAPAVSIGQATGLSPAKLDFIARTMWTSNYWTALAGAPWRATTDGLPADVQDEINKSMSNQLAARLSRRFYRQTRPGADPGVRLNTELERGMNSARGRAESILQNETIPMRQRVGIAKQLLDRWNQRAQQQVAGEVVRLRGKGEEPGSGLFSRFTFEADDIRRLINKVTQHQSFLRRQRFQGPSQIDEATRRQLQLDFGLSPRRRRRESRSRQSQAQRAIESLIQQQGAQR